MARLTKAISKDLFDNVLPTFGSNRLNVPIWDSSQKMFICHEYESAKGNRYYVGIRFCDQVVIVEKVGLFQNWTYLDGLELYAFNGTKFVLIQKRDYDKVFRNEEFIRSESESMICDYLMGTIKFQETVFNIDDVNSEARRLVEGCYKSFLEPDFNARLMQIIPAIKQ